MSDRDEKKPLDDDDELGFLEELGDLIDEDLSLSDAAAAAQPSGEDDSLEPLELVGDAAEAGTETAAEPPDNGLNFVADEAEEIVGEAERRVEEAVDTAREEFAEIEDLPEGAAESTVPFEPWSEAADEEVSAVGAIDVGDQEVAEFDLVEMDPAPLQELAEPVVEFAPEASEELEQIETPEPALEVAEAEPVVDTEPIVEVSEESVAPVVSAAADTGDATAKIDQKPTKPFDLHEPEKFKRMAIAPAVPSKRGVLGNLLMAVIGFALGAVALQAGLWWGLGKDPLGLSPLVPSWAVPSSMRSDSLAAAPTTSTLPTAPASIPDGSSAGSTDDPATSSGDQSANLEAPSGIAAAAVDEPAEAPNGDPADGTLEMSEPPSLSSPDDEILATAPAAAGAEQAPSPLDKPNPKNAAVYSRNDLAAAIVLAKASDEKLDQARINKSPDLRAAAEEFYRAFANLGEKATYVRRTGAAEVLSSSRDLLSSFEFDDRKQRMIANATRSWIKNELGIGVFGAANVTSIQPMGTDLYEVSITLMGRAATPLTVLTRLNPENNDLVRYSVGDRILFLGTIVKKAKERIEGYTGMDETVIWITDQVVSIP